MAPRASLQAERINASVARKAAGVIRELAYARMVADALAGDTEAAGRLFRARQAFTPGWSSRPRPGAQSPWDPRPLVGLVILPESQP